MLPVIASKISIIRRYNFPVDFGKSWKGKRILGSHKTVRGLLVGIVGGMLIAFVEQIYMPKIFLDANPFIVGFLLSFGALAGDSVKSFFKRQVGISSGKSWFPFDQLDYILGGSILSLLAIQLPIGDYIRIGILYFLLHLVVSYVGFLLSLKSSAL